MGKWSDGVPITPLKIQDAAPIRPRRLRTPRRREAGRNPLAGRPVAWA